MADTESLFMQLHSMSVFRNLLQDPLLGALLCVLNPEDKLTKKKVDAYSALAAILFEENASLSASLLRRLLDDENAYVFKRAGGQDIPPELEESLRRELAILEELAGLSPAELKKAAGWDGPLPGWSAGTESFLDAYRLRMDSLHTEGYGIFRRAHMFSMEEGSLVPVALPDPITLSELKGYERERNAVIQNTLFLLKGKPAANVLLYGDAGSGKSSTVKAIANEYRSRGLRLAEIGRRQFAEIPRLYAQLADNPLKFILFIDDLSFDQTGDDFKALKAILQGSASAKAPNIAVYATSNRRHLVRESFSDRSGDDIHLNETIQELTSLSERFGLQVPFLQPDRELYLRIVRSLARQLGVRKDQSDLDLEAERYALMRGGRSPRVARQFIDFCLNTQD